MLSSVATAIVLFGLAVAVLVMLAIAGRGEGGAPGRPEPEPGVPGEAVAEIAIEDHIDLHGFQPRDIPDVVRSYLEAAHAEGHRQVRLIHGRGKGVQRQRVREVLEAHPLVVRHVDAPRHRGGWGATIAWLCDAPRAGSAPGDRTRSRRSS